MMSIRDCTSRPPTKEWDAAFDDNFPGRTLDRYCEVCGLLPRWCECAKVASTVPRDLKGGDDG